MLFCIWSPFSVAAGHVVLPSRPVTVRDLDLLELVTRDLTISLKEDRTLCGLGGPSVGSNLQVLVTRDGGELVTWINPVVKERLSPVRWDMADLTMCPTAPGERKPRVNVSFSREIMVESGLSQRVSRRVSGHASFCLEAYVTLFREGAVCA